MTQVDGYPGAAGLVPANGSGVTLPAMLAPPSHTVNADNYGFGWFVYSPTQWGHSGSDPGARSNMERYQDTDGNVFCWAAVTNSRDDTLDLTSEFRTAVTGMIGQVSAWKSYKL